LFLLDGVRGKLYRSLSFVAPLATVNDALARLYYRSPMHWHGDDSIVFRVSDRGTVSSESGAGEPLSHVSSIAVVVSPTDDEPVVVFPDPQKDGYTWHVLEDQPEVLRGTSLCGGSCARVWLDAVLFL
jgi:hypothetical protein